MRNLCLTFILFTTLFAACRYAGGKRVSGDGKLATEQRSISGFSGIDVTGSYNVFVSQGADYSVKIEGDQNLLEYIEIEQRGDMLEVSSRNGYNLRPHNGIKIYITSPQIERLEVSGSGNITAQTKITNTNKLDVSVGGSGNVTLNDVDAPSIRSDVGGSGSISLKGTTQNFSADIAGSGEVHAFELLSETTDINVAGSGNAEVFASKQLDVNIAGSGDVRYKGNPSVKQSKVGSGDVRKVD